MWVIEYYTHFVDGWRWSRPGNIYVPEGTPGSRVNTDGGSVKTNAFWTIEQAMQVLLNEALYGYAKSVGTTRLCNATTGEIIPEELFVERDTHVGD